MTIQTYPYEIDYYKTPEGKAPFKDWLEALRDVNGRAKIRIRLDRARPGNLGDHKPIDEESGNYELITARGIVSISKLEVVSALLLQKTTSLTHLSCLSGLRQRRKQADFASYRRRQEHPET